MEVLLVGIETTQTKGLMVKRTAEKNRKSWFSRLVMSLFSRNSERVQAKRKM